MPHIFVHPPSVWMPHMFVHPHMFGSPCMFGPLLYGWMPPICLETSHMFGSPHIFVHPPYVWMTLYVLDTSYIFGCPPYVWMPICLDTPCVCLDDKACFLCVVCNTAGNTLLLQYLVLYIVLNLLKLALQSLATCLKI